MRILSLAILIAITFNLEISSGFVRCEDYFSNRSLKNELVKKVDLVRRAVPSFVNQLDNETRSVQFPNLLRSKIRSRQRAQITVLKKLLAQIRSLGALWTNGPEGALSKAIHTLERVFDESEQEHPHRNDSLWSKHIDRLSPRDLDDIRYNLNGRMLKFDSFLLELLVALKTPGMVTSQIHVRQIPNRVPSLGDEISQLGSFSSIRNKEIDILASSGMDWIEVKSVRGQIDEFDFWNEYEEKFEKLSIFQTQANNSGIPIQQKIVFVAYNLDFVPEKLIEDLESLGFEVLVTTPRILVSTHVLQD